MLTRRYTTLRSVASAAAFAAAALVAAPALAGPAPPTPVEVTITGEVEFNQVNTGPLGNVNPGDDFTLTFLLDSSDFLDSATFPTRGYNLAPGSLTLDIGSETLGLLDPFAAETPMFILRDDDPAVDGFFLGTHPDGFNNGVALDEPGVFGPFRMNFSVTYNNDPLSSLDILGAEGTYDFTGLTVFNTTIDDGGFQPVGMIFEQMTIEVVPEPTSAALLGFAGMALLQRRRRPRNRA